MPSDPAPSDVPLAWLDFGDLHVDAADGYASLRDFAALVAEANAHLGTGVDFAFLPGDNANHGERAQYDGIRRVVADLRLPLHVIPGDHDFEPGSLDAFYAAFADVGHPADAPNGARRLPYAVTVRGHRCLFLDTVSAGSGGPDLRLGAEQTAWVARELAAAARDAGRPVVFMHAFPGDLAAGGEALAHAFADAHVALVSTGHTHYNEVLNDGCVVYSATRSTGQVEEGPPGFAIAAVDGNAPSWRFRTLGAPWPFVLITTPADAQLATASTDGTAPAPPTRVRALVLGAESAPGCRVELSVDGGMPVPMERAADAPALWSAPLAALGPGAHTLIVAARDGDRTLDHDAITIAVADARPWTPVDTPPPAPPPGHEPPPPPPEPVLGDHTRRIGPWVAHGVLGTQLGPNANGRKW